MKKQVAEEWDTDSIDIYGEGIKRPGQQGRGGQHNRAWGLPRRQEGNVVGEVWWALGSWTQVALC